MEQALYIINHVIYVLFPLSVINAYILWKRNKSDLKESLVNLASNVIGRQVRNFITGGILLGVLFFTAKFSFFKLEMTALNIALTFLLADFIYYWKHRFSHEWRFLWSYHSVHHSSKEFNLTTALRLPWVGNFPDALFYVPAVLMGFDPLTLVVGKGLVLIFQYPIHTDSVGYLPYLDGLFNTPSNHRVHHGSNPVYLDKNHGGVLIIWDRLFGTYQRELESEAVQYGLTKPIGSQNLLKIQFMEIMMLAKGVLTAPDWKSRWQRLIQKT